MIRPLTARTRINKLNKINNRNLKGHKHKIMNTE